MIKQTPKRLFVFRLALALLSSFTLAQAGDEKASDPKPAAIAIKEMKRMGPVDFEKEILPILKNNCLACHNQTKAKADLVLETPQTILKGGELGPAVIPGRAAESLLLKSAAHQSEPMMPPRDNKVAALNLTPDELGLLKLWIDQGARGEVRAAATITWKALPQSLKPIYAVAMTLDGQFAACGRANQIFVYHVPSGQFATQLTDPQLLKEGLYGERTVAHRDMVHSLAFHSDGTLLASGDYRQAKLWRRPRNVQKLSVSDVETNAWKAVAVSVDGKWLATGHESGKVKLFDLATGKETKVLLGAEKAIMSLKFSLDGSKLAAGSADQKIWVWSVVSAELFAEVETPGEIQALTWAKGGAQILSGGTDKVIRVWKLPDAPKGNVSVVKELKGHEGPITSLDTVLSAEHEIISGSSDGSLRHWNTEKGALVREMKHGGPIASVAVRMDGKRFASAGLNQVAKLWDATDGKQIAAMKGDRHAQEAVQEAERTLAFATSEVSYHKTTVQSAETEQKTQTNRVTKATEALGTAEKVLGEKQKQFETAKTAKSDAEKALAALQAELKKVTDDYQSADKAAKQAEAEARASIDKAAQAKISADQAAELKVIGERIAADTAAIAAKTKAAADHEAPGGTKETAKKSTSEVGALAQKAKEIAESMAADFSAKSKAASESKTSAETAIGALAAKSFAAGQLKPLFDKITAESAEKQKQATNQIETATKALAEAEKEFKKAELAKTGVEKDVPLAKKSVEQSAETVAAAKSALQKAEAELKSADAQLQASKKFASETEKPLRAIAFSPDNLTLGTAGDDHVVRTWSADTGAAFETFKGHTSSVSAIAFTKESALVSAGPDRKAIVWNLHPAWTLERVLGTGDVTSPIADRVNALRFSPDGKWLATGSGEPSRGGEIKIWQVADGKLVHDLKNVHSDAVFSLDFSADGKFLASGAADKFVKVVELPTGKVVKSLEGHTHHVLGVSWKRDGRTLASSGADNVIKIWDFITGERKKTIEGFGKEVTTISFVGPTDQAVACSGDNQVSTIKENGEKVRSFEGANDFIYSAAVTPDGKIVIAGGQDSVLRVWNGTNGQVLAAFAPAGGDLHRLVHPLKTQ